MKVTSLQLQVVEDDKEAVLETTYQAILNCQGADLVLLPELWNIGFMDFPSYISLAEKEDGPTLSMLREVAQKKNIHLHSGSFVEEDGGKYYNSSYLIGVNGEILQKYRKIHLFGYDSHESSILTAGADIAVVSTDIGVFGLATCFDLRFPELFRHLVEMGAEAFLVPAAWPMIRRDHWRLFTQARALENQCYLISANSCGASCGTALAGTSMVVHPRGDIVAEAGLEGEVLSCEVDMDEVAEARRAFPSLSSRNQWL